MRNTPTPEELAEKIRKAFVDIRDNEMTMKETGITRMLSDLNLLRENPTSRLGGESLHQGPVDILYLQLTAEWKEVFAVYLSTKKGAQEIQLARAKKALNQQKAINSAIKVSSGSAKDISDSELSRGPSGGKEGRARTPRVTSEKKVPKQTRPKGDRDRKTYTFEGEEYGKGKLVHAIIKKHATKNPKMTVPQLKAAFPDHLLKGYGLVRVLKEAQEISKKHTRFFLREDQLIKCTDGVVAVCNQFSAENIKPFFEHATKLGYKIGGL